VAIKESSLNTAWSDVTNRAVYGINNYHESFHAIDSRDLESLKDAIEMWSGFLHHVFLNAGQGNISQEDLRQIALEDTELYLDIKIKLSQCMSSVEDDAAANQLEMLCNAIRKNSYNFIAMVLPKLNESSSLHLVANNHRPELAHPPRREARFTESGRDKTKTGSAHERGFTLNRKKALFLIQKQHREIIRRLHKLNRKIDSTLIAEEFEL
jgi:hypothetical protein